MSILIIALFKERFSGFLNNFIVFVLITSTFISRLDVLKNHNGVFKYIYSIRLFLLTNNRYLRYLGNTLNINSFLRSNVCITHMYNVPFCTKMVYRFGLQVFEVFYNYLFYFYCHDWIIRPLVTFCIYIELISYRVTYLFFFH